MCIASPLMAQLMTPLPFGQRGALVTPLPFGQRSNSPLHSMTAAAASSPTLQLVAQWNMAETSGTTMYDSSGSGINGTLYHVSTTGSGYVFNGSTSKVVVPDSPSLNPGSKDFAYTAQVQTAAVPPKDGDYDVIRHGAAATDGGGYRLEIEYSKGIGEAYCSISDSTGHTLSIRGTTNVTDGKTHTLTCSKNANGISLQVDSLAPCTKTGTLGSIANAKPFLLGVKSETTTSSNGDWYNGTLHGVTVSVAQ